MAELRSDDPDGYVHGTPFSEFARLRREAPFAGHEASQMRGGFRLSTRHSARLPAAAAIHAPAA